MTGCLQSRRRSWLVSVVVFGDHSGSSVCSCCARSWNMSLNACGEAPASAGRHIRSEFAPAWLHTAPKPLPATGASLYFTPSQRHSAIYLRSSTPRREIAARRSLCCRLLVFVTDSCCFCKSNLWATTYLYFCRKYRASMTAYLQLCGRMSLSSDGLAGDYLWMQSSLFG